MEIKLINKSREEEIAKLAICLSNETIECTGINHSVVDENWAITLCKNYIESEQCNVIAAFEADRIIAFGALCESRSLFSEGTFGVIQEFYVLPEYRSQRIGKKIIEEMVFFAYSKQWKRLELCTPPIPEFDRTVEFYKENGFYITGGYSMKKVIVE